MNYLNDNCSAAQHIHRGKPSIIGSLERNKVCDWQSLLFRRLKNPPDGSCSKNMHWPNARARHGDKIFPKANVDE
jgi:hypothetical protein